MRLQEGDVTRPQTQPRFAALFDAPAKFCPKGTAVPMPTGAAQVLAYGGAGKKGVRQNAPWGTQLSSQG